MPKPLVSIILPIYNAERFLRQAIDSVIGQTYTDFELLAIDDGSTDRSREILASYADKRLKVLCNNGNLGLIYSLNFGLATACGEFVARMDADDISQPTRLEEQVDFLRKYHDVALVGTAMEEIDENNEHLGCVYYPVENSEIQQRLLSKSCFCHPSVMFRRDAVLNVGGYRSEFMYAEDYDLWLRLSEKYKLANLGRELLRYRIHMSQTCFTKQAYQYKATQYCISEALRRRGILDENVRKKYLHTGWDRATAAERTIGANFIDFANAFGMRGLYSDALHASGMAVRYSPLSHRAWRTFIRWGMVLVLGKKAINHMHWYLFKIKSLFDHGNKFGGIGE
jgi:glycosyltransferase involved in cell wall biosynthesis